MDDPAPDVKSPSRATAAHATRGACARIAAAAPRAPEAAGSVVCQEARVNKRDAASTDVEAAALAVSALSTFARRHGFVIPAVPAAGLVEPNPVVLQRDVARAHLNAATPAIPARPADRTTGHVLPLRAHRLAIRHRDARQQHVAAGDQNAAAVSRGETIGDRQTRDRRRHARINLEDPAGVVARDAQLALARSVDRDRVGRVGKLELTVGQRDRLGRAAQIEVDRGWRCRRIRLLDGPAQRTGAAIIRRVRDQKRRRHHPSFQAEAVRQKRLPFLPLRGKTSPPPPLGFASGIEWGYARSRITRFRHRTARLSQDAVKIEAQSSRQREQPVPKQPACIALPPNRSRTMVHEFRQSRCHTLAAILAIKLVP